MIIETVDDARIDAEAVLRVAQKRDEEDGVLITRIYPRAGRYSIFDDYVERYIRPYFRRGSFFDVIDDDGAVLAFLVAAGVPEIAHDGAEIPLFMVSYVDGSVRPIEMNR
jgi:hypothetical protein